MKNYSDWLSGIIDSFVNGKDLIWKSDEIVELGEDNESRFRLIADWVNYTIAKLETLKIARFEVSIIIPLELNEKSLLGQEKILSRLIDSLDIYETSELLISHLGKTDSKPVELEMYRSPVNVDVFELSLQNIELFYKEMYFPDQPFGESQYSRDLNLVYSTDWVKESSI